MNPSNFMDKQVMGLSGSENNENFDHMNPQEEKPNNCVGDGGNIGGIKDLREEILPSYDFQPIQPIGASLHSDNFEGSNVGGTRVWNSVDNKTNPTNIREKDCNALIGVAMSDIDETVKKYADNMLQALVGVSDRLSQLDVKTRHIESSVDDLKLSVANNHGNNDRKLGQLENILREVQNSVQLLRDKQEILEAQFELARLRPVIGEKPSENPNTTYHTDFLQQKTASASQVSNQSASPPLALPQAPQPLAILPPNSPHIPPVQLPAQFPQSQISSTPQPEPHFPPPYQLAEEPIHQHYQLTPPAQQTQPAPLQHCQSTNQLPPHYSQQASHPPQQSSHLSPINLSLPSQLQPPLNHHQPEETLYVPSQSYPPSIRQSPSMNQPPSSAPPSQPLYGGPTHIYEPLPPLNRPNSGFSSAYGGQPSGVPFSDSYPYDGSPTHYRSSTKPPHFFSSTPVSNGENHYSLIPTAQLLPQTIPTSTNDIGGSNSSGGSGNRIPIDDVVDKVATMGFSREQVRSTVRKLTENGQSVDLNVVLDKLMNEHGDVQPQKGWFRR